MINTDILKNVIEQYGTPVYVFEEERFIKNYLNLQNTFRKIYPKYQIAYSYKTNYTPYICKLIKQLDGFAEVVSDMEYDLAKTLAYENCHIVYNGPVKGPKLEEHILEGGINNVDNYEEAERIIALAKTVPDQIVEVGLRINTDIGAGFVSRFGIEENSESLRKIIHDLKHQPNIKIVGLHCHIGRSRNKEAWQRRIYNLINIADKYIEGIPKYINVGSGMFGEMDPSFAAQFNSPIPSYDEYAEIVAGAMRDRYSIGNNAPVLFSEPGSTVISNYMSLITQVKSKKYIRNNSFIVVDSSYYNVGEICLKKKLPYTIIKENKGGIEILEDNQSSKKIVGYTCLEGDCLHFDFTGALEVNDYIIFGNVGGYSVVSKPPFIQPNCGVVAVRPNNELIEIKRSETFTDIFNTYLF